MIESIVRKCIRAGLFLQPALLKEAASEYLQKGDREFLEAVMRLRPALLDELLRERLVETIPGPLADHLVSSSQGANSLAVRQLAVRLGVDGALGGRDDVVVMPPDDVIFPIVFEHGYWQPETCDFLIEYGAAAGKCALLDIGANVGLVTRQVLRRTEAVSVAVCVEPDPLNFSCLEVNLKPFEQAELLNYGLARAEGKMELLRDLSNHGNYSFNPSAVEGLPHDRVEVTVNGVNAFYDEIAGRIGDLPLVYKSDTQGFDELIVANTPERVWDRVRCAVIELARIDKPDYDVDAFRWRVDRFPNKKIGNRPVASSDDVISYAQGNGGYHEDLFLWR